MQEIHLFKKVGYITWTLTIASTSLFHSSRTTITQTDAATGLISSGTLRDSLLGNGETTLVVVTSLGVVLDAWSNILIHEDSMYV